MFSWKHIHAWSAQATWKNDWTGIVFSNGNGLSIWHMELFGQTCGPKSVPYLWTINKYPDFPPSYNVGPPSYTLVYNPI